jgi:hypothetical protein
MPSSLSTLLIVAFASLLLGVVAGLLFSSMRGEREEVAKPEQEAPPGGRPGRYLPVMRLWREKTTGTIVVEVDGKSYLKPDPLSTLQRDELEKAVAELSGWLGVVVTAIPLPTARPASVQQPTAAQPAPVQRTPVQAPIVPAEPVRSTGALKLPLPGVAAVTQMPKEAPKSIVGQIDAILQEMLLGLGMENRGIALNEDPRKGVVVSIGLERFDGIDAVKDLEVKKILRAAVNEWERRQEVPPH